MMCSNCFPSIAMHRRRRSFMEFIVDKIICLGMLSMELLTRCFISSRLAGSVLKTSFLTYPQRKKSKGDKSGDLGGHGVVPPRPIHWLGKDSSTNLRASEEKCGGAPSCWNHIFFSAASGNSEANSETTPFKTHSVYFFPVRFPSMK